MRTSHIQIRKLIADEKKKITDKELFTSPAFAAYLTDIAETASKRYKREIEVKTFWDETLNAEIASTDNNNISINTGNYITRSFSERKLCATSIVGFNAHEIAHILYTDFILRSKYFDSLSAGIMYPYEPFGLSPEDEINLAEIMDIFASKEKTAIKVIAETANKIRNIIEDGYVDSLMCSAFPGIFKAGIIMNNSMILEKAPAIEEQTGGGYHSLSIIMNMFIQYRIARDKTTFGSYTGEYLDVFNKCAPFIDNSIYSSDANVRFDAVNNIIIKIWQYIKPLIEQAKDEEKNRTDTLDQILDDLFSELIKQLISMGSEPAGKGKPVAAGDISSDTGGMTAGCASNVTGPAISDNTGHILEKIAEQKVYKKLEKELIKELQSEADKIYSEGDIDMKIKVIRKNKITDVMIEQYKVVSPPLLVLLKRLQQMVYQALKEKRDGGKMTGLYMGKRINTAHLVRNDGRIFYNNRLPEDDPDIAVALLVDESGSMRNDDRCISARNAGIILYDFCVKLDIPVIVYGHSTTEDEKTVEMFSYAEFDAYDNSDMYRLTNITHRHYNHDGAALRFVANRLLARGEKIKLLILISDGRPNAGNYTGDIAEKDLHKIKREYTNKGITMFAAAIGDDKENIERIYGGGYLDITNLDKLPVNLTSLIIKYLK